MIIDKKKYNDPDNTLGYIECIYESSNILSTLYFPKTDTLYISFKRGGTYKYLNVNEEKYNKFENSESQGKFFLNEIRNKDEHPYSKEFSLKEFEIQDAEKVIKEWKEQQTQATKN